MKDYKNILIVRTDRMGDVVLTTPSFKAVRAAYPKAKISALVVSPMEELIAGDPYLDEVIVHERKIKYKGPFGFWRLAADLRRKKFDLAIIFHTKKWTNSLCFFAGIPDRLGYKNDKWGFLLTHPIEDTRHLGTMHESDYCLELLKHLGIRTDSKEFYVCVKPASKQWVRDILIKHKVGEKERLIAIHPGASDPSRRWPPYLYAELIDQLARLYQAKYMIIGDPAIKDVAQKILALVKTPVLDLTGDTSVSEFVSLIDRCDLLISNDSGPVHVAVGLNRPVISIFTRNQPGINPERWKPLGEKTRFVSVPMDDSISFARAGEIDPKYLELIRTEEVLRAVDDIFKLC